MSTVSMLEPGFPIVNHSRASKDELLPNPFEVSSKVQKPRGSFAQMGQAFHTAYNENFIWPTLDAPYETIQKHFQVLQTKVAAERLARISGICIRRREKSGYFSKTFHDVYGLGKTGEDTGVLLFSGYEKNYDICNSLICFPSCKDFEMRLNKIVKVPRDPDEEQLEDQGEEQMFLLMYEHQKSN